MLAGYIKGMCKIQVHNATAGVEHFIVELFLSEVEHLFVSHGRVFAFLSLSEQVGYNGQSMLLAPVFQYIRRTVDVGELQECLVCILAEGHPVIVFIGYPFRINVPEHPLRSHFKESAASPGFALSVTSNLTLEAVSQFVGNAIQLFVL